MVACPKCNGELSQREVAAQDSVVKCPHCHASYPLSDALLHVADDDDGQLRLDLNDLGDEVGLDDELELECDSPISAAKSGFGAGLDPLLPATDVPATDMPVDSVEDGDGPRDATNPLLGGAAIAALGATGAAVVGDILFNKAGEASKKAQDAIESAKEAAAKLSSTVLDKSLNKITDAVSDVSNLEADINADIPTTDDDIGLDIELEIGGPTGEVDFEIDELDADEVAEFEAKIAGADLDSLESDDDDDISLRRLGIGAIQDVADDEIDFGDEQHSLSDAELEAELFSGSDDDIDLEAELQAASDKVQIDDDIEIDFDEPAEFENMVADDGLAIDELAIDELVDDELGDVAGQESDDVRSQMIDDAIQTAPAEDVAVEVVKPFDFRPGPGQVSAKNFKPGLPRSGGGLVSSLLKFGTGGLLGLALCQAGLWWIGRIDPLGLAAKLPDAVGFLAPGSVRSPYRSLVANRPPSLDTIPVEQRTVERLPVPDGGGFDGRDLSDVDGGDLDAEFNAADVDEGFAATSDAATDQDLLGDTPDEMLPNGFEIDPDAATSSPETGDDLFGTNDGVFDAEQPAAPAFGLVSKRQLHRNDLSAAIGEANRTLGAFRAASAAKASREVRQSRIFEFYDAMAKMSETAMHVSDDAAPVLEQMNSFIQGISEPKFAAAMGSAAGRRLQDDVSEGVFLSGTITKQSPLTGGYQHLQVKLLGVDPKAFEVIAPDSMIANLNSRVYVLGIRVADPTLDIAGLEQSVLGEVIWSDQIITVR